MTFPFKGKTPYKSRPTTLDPATAIDLAESPSVKIKIQSSDFFVPAKLASSNLGTLIFGFFEPSVFLHSLFCLNSANDKTRSTIPDLSIIFFKNLDEISGLDPNFD